MNKDFKHELGHLLIKYGNIEKRVNETMEFLWHMPDNFESPNEKFKHFVTIFAELYFNDFKKHYEDN